MSSVVSQAFAKRFGAIQNQRGKRKDLSAQDAALLIQLSFRAYLIRRSKALRALRELAVAKSKLKEVRAQFNNFAYRRHLSRDAEERQKFSEKIIVLLLTVDAIEVMSFPLYVGLHLMLAKSFSSFLVSSFLYVGLGFLYVKIS